ncbi:hypothetical protein PsYK624_012350 [Phanerochaete sordida]|uniref:Uncharacterized protein n=1 Tax=Phanerochaete sordida TaxID=48140 RepID=A0A9P3FZ30_9APHY|nr:hypothetical protein PsYK624_012350 [Phanerochaete sordida]
MQAPLPENAHTGPTRTRLEPSYAAAWMYALRLASQRLQRSSTQPSRFYSISRRPARLISGVRYNTRRLAQDAGREGLVHIRGGRGGLSPPRHADLPRSGRRERRGLQAQLRSTGTAEAHSIFRLCTARRSTGSAVAS